MTNPLTLPPLPNAYASEQWPTLDRRGINHLTLYTADQLRAYATEAVRAAMEAQWRPMSEAPNDSTVVMFCDAFGNRWIDCSPGHPGNSCGFPAVRWMPLPPAPTAPETTR